MVREGSSWSIVFNGAIIYIDRLAIQGGGDIVVVVVVVVVVVEQGGGESDGDGRGCSGHGAIPLVARLLVTIFL